MVSSDELGSVNQLLSGTFHEIQPVLRFIEIDSVKKKANRAVRK